MRLEDATSAKADPWYAVQVPTGSEAKLCSLIERMVPEGLVRECFTPRYATQIKRRGEWVDVRKPLLPGYVIAVSDDVDALALALRRIPEFTRLLSMGESFVPLAREERAWMEAFTVEGDRCIGMSEAVMEGDRVVVLSGPLLGREALITSVNRHKNLAMVEFELCGRRVTAKLGLGIVSRKDDGT